MRRDTQPWAAGHITGGAFLVPSVRFEFVSDCREGRGGRSVPKGSTVGGMK